MVRLNQKGLHADEFALAEIVKGRAISGLPSMARGYCCAGLQVDEFLRGDGFGAARGGSAEIVLHLVLNVAVCGSGGFAFDTAGLVNGMSYFDGGERQWRSVVALIGKRSLRESCDG